MRTLILLAACLPLIAGCLRTAQMDDPEIRHPLTLEDRPVSFRFAQTRDGTWFSPDGVSVRDVAVGYRETGEGMMMLAGQPEARAALGNALGRYGVAEHRMLPAAASAGAADSSEVTVSFTALYVRVPACGEQGTAAWPASIGYEAINTPTSNFGCATQRNLGLMIARPRDLVEPTRSDQGLDATRHDSLLGVFRAPESVGSADVDTSDVDIQGNAPE